MTKHLRDYLVYRYQYNNMKESAVSVRAVGPDRTQTLDTLPPVVIRMTTVHAKNKAEAYRIAVQEGGL